MMSRWLAALAIFVVTWSTTYQVQAASPRWEPQISVLCEAGQTYHPQYLSEEGRWSTDLSIKVPGSTCLRDKMDLLDYCKKVYPGRDITNIVESSHYQKIGGWCRQGALNSAKCKGAQRWIKPFRCLEGPFQSDALLVPEGCLFDHIHNASRCWPFIRWNQTGAAACQDRNMQMRSFAMLLPCGISLFSGVEFVCCPKHFKVPMKVKKTDLPVLPQESEVLPALDDADADNSEDDDDEDDIDDDEDEDMLGDEPIESDDDEYDSEEDFDADKEPDTGSAAWDSFSTPMPLFAKDKKDIYTTTASSTTEKQTEIPTTPITAIPTPDPYFTHFDPRYEHQSFKSLHAEFQEAQQRLEESHREKVTRVMKDWSDLEEKYQDMRLADPKTAQTFKQRMTARFQTSVQALEEEGNSEKHQLAAMHQQRVLAHINQRKREAMTCYTQALTEQPPNAHRVEKCLQKLLRALHKDRAHALSHYRHLLGSGGAGGLEAAASERPRTLERLVDIDRAVNQSMSMLKRYPELSTKLSQLMDDYIQALRSKDETPGSMLAMTEDAESAILDKYRMEIERKVSEKERQRLAEKQRKEQRAQEREKIREEKLRLEAKKMEAAYKQQQQQQQQIQQQQPSQQPQPQQSQPLQQQQPQQQQPQVQTQIPISEQPQTQKQIELETQKDTEATRDYTEEATISNSPQSTALPTVDDEAVQRAVEEVAAAVAHQEAEPKMQHILSHDTGHSEPTFSVRREIYGPNGRENRNVYFTLMFAFVALMGAVFVGVAVAKWKASRSPHAQGFVEVDQAVGQPITPEERHVANMQINGYENPTYKYFEVKE
ncbi:beta-amyloid-like protein isoform X1 [Aedes aegypti]|uniref:Beta-amyloid-like protein n=1 Tax=Aedes aegypti TaxID=7159 RepID=A0A6I8TC36_AEDAE|nr:beta-amyloid-like protein isoform X1 [Aedes aegypti]XP_021709739.1 beta-amyloid-like protein isoform X1 [Aedes aegypti]XP_021709741.1 beta-amyloid-like protein isoform X1 [Aedes aegypti]XP_021709742.1 beta-amyloid-like protein isoform X1 [Aedes aegypti]